MEVCIMQAGKPLQPYEVVILFVLAALVVTLTGLLLNVGLQA
jgi:hypothetical protein